MNTDSGTSKCGKRSGSFPSEDFASLPPATRWSRTLPTTAPSPDRPQLSGPGHAAPGSRQSWQRPDACRCTSSQSSCVSIGLLVVNASLLVINTAATMDSNAQYARSYEIKRALSTFQSVITAAESGQRGYLLTGQTGYLEPYYVAMRSWRTEIERLRKLTGDNPVRQQDIATGAADRRRDRAGSSRRSSAARSPGRTAVPMLPAPSARP